MPEAVKAYDVDIAKFGADYFRDIGLLAKAEKCIIDSQCTALESHLARSLRKPVAEQFSSIEKYMSLFADVDPKLVLKPLWEEAQRVLSKGV